MYILKFYKEKGLFWIRLFGIGFSCKDTSIHKLLFSERNGHRKGLMIGKFLFHFIH